MSILKVACIQMTSGPDIAQNLKMVEMQIREAASKGAQLIATPENTDQIRMPPAAKLGSAPVAGAHPGEALFAALAKELGVWLLIGSMSVKVADDKVANRSFLFSPAGDLAASYDKIHLFDVQLPTGETHKESDSVAAGDRAVVCDMGADMGEAHLGLSICYDVRFSYLYRDLAKAGADILAVPAAFTVPTGRAHWEVLLRARAIETGSFVIAPAQVGEHENGRRTWGHAMIISPWGDILAQAGDVPEILYADLMLSHVRKAREAIPALQHDRMYQS